MPAFLRISLFLLICLTAVAGMAFASFSDKDVAAAAAYFLVGALCYGLLFYAWHYYLQHRETDPAQYRILYRVGSAIALLMAAYFLILGVIDATRAVRLVIFEKKVALANYKELPIVWSGFKQPVGVRIEFDLLQPLSLDGYVRSPRLLYGKQAQAQLADAGRNYWRFCQTAVVDGIVCLASPLWPMHEAQKLDDADYTHVIFELYPSNLSHFDSPDQLCLSEAAPYGLEYAWEDQAALWHFSVATVDIEMSEQFHRMLAEQSSLLTKMGKVQQMFSQMQKPALLAAGYEACEINTAIKFTETSSCYCRNKK